jgi:hypothetical protein
MQGTAFPVTTSLHHSKKLPIPAAILFFHILEELSDIGAKTNNYFTIEILKNEKDEKIIH